LSLAEAHKSTAYHEAQKQIQISRQQQTIKPQLLHASALTRPQKELPNAGGDQLGRSWATAVLAQ
jgi:hypothetical protein